MHTLKFRSLIDHLKDLSPEQYDHARLFDENGEMPVCAIGWANRWGIIEERLTVTDSYTAAAKYFDITFKEANYLFGLGKHSKLGEISPDETLEQVLVYFENFLEMKEKENNLWYNRLKLAWQKIIF